MAKRTQKAIINAFVDMLRQKPIDKITVMDICGASGVSRSTFYYHYNDIYYLLETLVEADLDRLLQSDFTLKTWHDLMLKNSAFAAKNKSVVSHVCEGLRYETLISYMFEIAETAFGALAREGAQGHVGVSKDDVEAVVRIVSATFVGLFFEWINRGMPEESFDEFANFGTSVNSYIELSFAKYPLCA